MKSNLIIEVASVNDRDSVIAEIWQDKEMIAEVKCELKGMCQIEIYPNTKGTVWSLDLNEWINALLEAKAKLT